MVDVLTSPVRAAQGQLLESRQGLFLGDRFNFTFSRFRISEKLAQRCQHFDTEEDRDDKGVTEHPGMPQDYTFEGGDVFVSTLAKLLSR